MKGREEYIHFNERRIVMIKDVKEELKDFEEKMAKMSPEEQREYGRSFGKSEWNISAARAVTMASLDLLDDEKQKKYGEFVKNTRK